MTAPLVLCRLTNPCLALSHFILSIFLCAIKTLLTLDTWGSGLWTVKEDGCNAGLEYLGLCCFLLCSSEASIVRSMLMLFWLKYHAQYQYGLQDTWSHQHIQSFGPSDEKRGASDTELKFVYWVLGVLRYRPTSWQAFSTCFNRS